MHSKRDNILCTDTKRRRAGGARLPLITPSVGSGDSFHVVHEHFGNISVGLYKGSQCSQLPKCPRKTANKITDQVRTFTWSLHPQDPLDKMTSSRAHAFHAHTRHLSRALSRSRPALHFPRHTVVLSPRKTPASSRGQVSALAVVRGATVVPRSDVATVPPPRRSFSGASAFSARNLVAIWWPSLPSTAYAMQGNSTLTIQFLSLNGYVL